MNDEPAITHKPRICRYWLIVASSTPYGRDQAMPLYRSFAWLHKVSPFFTAGITDSSIGLVYRTLSIFAIYTERPKSIFRWRNDALQILACMESRPSDDRLRFLLARIVKVVYKNDPTILRGAKTETRLDEFRIIANELIGSITPIWNHWALTQVR